MIPKREILELAQIKGVEPRIIEKDYVLGWLLAGINEHSALKKKWIFKGGTALKKCYFNDYRFSEDLDFTVLDESHINQEFLQNTFKNIFKNIRTQITNVCIVIYCGSTCVHTDFFFSVNDEIRI
jgi:predicted nucleotidyltransferase component of viral defense system